MRVLVAMLGLAMMAMPALAQQGDPVLMPYQPAVNSQWRISEVRTRLSRGDGAETERRGTSIGTLTVRTAGNDTFDVQWVVDSVEAGGIRVTDQPELLIGLPMQIRLDEVGTPSVIQDWDGLRRRVFEMMEQTTPANERDEQWRRSLITFEGMMAQWSPSHAAQVMAPTLAVVSLCQGMGLRLGEVFSSRVQMPNPLGGPPIDGTESVTLQSVTAGTATLVYSRSLDPASATASLGQSIFALAQQSGQPVAELEAQFAGHSFTHDARATCTVDRNTGVTRSVVHEVNVTFGPVARVDRREVTVVAK